MPTHVLNYYQVRWSMSMSRFKFDVTYWLKKQQGLLNALSKCFHLVRKEKEEAFYK